jgi:hypothetical protein
VTATTDIMSAFFSLLESEFPTTPIAWQGSDFTPPASGVWLEAAIFPNDPIHDGLRLEDSRTDQGILQVMVMCRPGPKGYFESVATVESVKAALPIGLYLTGLARIVSEPSEFRADIRDPDRLAVIVSSQYRG